MKTIIALAILLLTVPAMAAAPTIPTDGIWKSEDGTVSVYLQKYDTGSCILIVATDDGELTAFLDEDFSDGITAGDVWDMGYNLKFRLKKSNAGTLMVELPFLGTIRMNMFLSVAAE